jgi:alpha-tubulin suppressor-like RCC1 family protein
MVPPGLRSAVAIACCGGTVAATSDGTIFYWGSRAARNSDNNMPPDIQNVMAVGCGVTHAAAVCQDGKVVEWGSCGYGSSHIPAGLENVVAVSCGTGHTTALTQQGEVVCWGVNRFHECDVPTDLKDAVAISCYGNNSMALTAEGKLVCWGDNSVGQCDIPDNIAVMMLNILL